MLTQVTVYIMFVRETPVVDQMSCFLFGPHLVSMIEHQVELLCQTGLFLLS